MTTLETLRALEPLTAEQLRDASDAALLLMGWTNDGPTGRTDGWWYAPGTGGGDYLGSDRPHPAASIDDAAALMPEGYMVEVTILPDGRAVVRAIKDGEHPDTALTKRAHTEPYARMLAAVAAHLEMEK